MQARHACTGSIHQAWHPGSEVIVPAAAQVTRAPRQLILDRLAGQHLALALFKEDTPATPEAVAARPELRRAALQLAKQQELEIFQQHRAAPAVSWRASLRLCWLSCCAESMSQPAACLPVEAAPALSYGAQLDCAGCLSVK